MSKYLKISQILALTLVALFAITNSSYAVTPLQVNKAFKLTVVPAKVDAIVLQWHIAKDYFLYKDRIHISIENNKTSKLGKIHLPGGIKKYDEVLGHYQVYEKQLTLSIPFLLKQKTDAQLKIDYQGCSAAGFCYPPISKVLIIKQFPILSVADYSLTNPLLMANPQTLNAQDKAESLLTYHNIFIALIAFFGFGLLLAFTPCVLPMIPILSAIIIDNQQPVKPRRAFALSLTYVLAMSVAFALAGILVGYIGESLQASLQIPWVIFTFAVIFILLALSLFGLYEIRIPKRIHNFLHHKQQQQRSGSYIGVAIMGFLAMLVVSPCVTPPLVGALTYIAHTGNSILGGSALFMMSLGMGIPLLIIGTSLGSVLPKAGAWMETVKRCFGLIMLAMAIWISQRMLPDAIVMSLWGILALFTAWLLKPWWKSTTVSTLLRQITALLLIAYGLLLMIATGMGHVDPLNPFKKPAAELSAMAKFHPIQSPQDLKQQLQKAKQQRKYVLLDFYADWCVACKHIDKRIFADPEVQNHLKQFYLVRANITANSPQNKALLQQLNVIAPPTVIFFGQNSDELSRHRMVGEFNKTTFLKQIESILPKKAKKTIK